VARALSAIRAVVQTYYIGRQALAAIGGGAVQPAASFSTDRRRRRKVASLPR